MAFRFVKDYFVRHAELVSASYQAGCCSTNVGMPVKSLAAYAGQTLSQAQGDDGRGVQGNKEGRHAELVSASEKPSRHCNKGLKAAFTLAEVLITLAIIGIIAAITIPSIIANHQKRTLETQFAKAYRTLSQAVNLAIANHGGIETWDWINAPTYLEKDNFVKKYFFPYLNIVKFCPAGSSVPGCFPDLEYKRMDGSSWGNRGASGIHPRALLADGSSVQFLLVKNCLETNDRCFAFDIDINGHKKPNIVGYDVFSFNMYPQTNEFLPNGVNGSYDSQVESFMKLTEEEIIQNCGGGGLGWYCAARVVMDGFKINY